MAEPLTGLVDTAFINRLGADALAALGVGTVALSSLFWIFNFIGISTQTEVAQAEGHNNRSRSMEITSLGIILSSVFGVLILAAGLPITGILATSLGADGSVHIASVEYISWRWWGAPAVLITMTGMGALRGLQDMRAALWISLIVNFTNIILDAALIFGAGPIPALGIGGAALASVIAQWVGAACVVGMTVRKLGWSFKVDFGEIAMLMRIGSDLFIRTGMLNLFLLLATRKATQLGADSGAANQAIRQVWMFGTLVLDSYAVTGQSLVAFFIGGGKIKEARLVGKTVCMWGVLSGFFLAGLMWIGEPYVIEWLVPASAVALFSSAWLIALIVQPINALAFATDGLHWGTGDYRYLRNAVVLATTIGSIGLLLGAHSLNWVWIMTDIWILVRAAMGIIRIWPGVGHSPYNQPDIEITAPSPGKS